MHQIAFFPLESAKQLKARLPGNAVIWAPIIDPADNEELANIHMLAVAIDALMRTDDFGFADTHFVFTNDPSAEDVAWERTQDGYALHLCAVSGQHWSQVIYQLGYAMTHCLIDHLNPSESHAVPWAEELICEACALLLLHFAADNWDEVPLSQSDEDYAGRIYDDLRAYLKDEGTSAFLRCQDRAAFEKLAHSSTFADRLDESHDLYWRAFQKDLPALAHVRDFAADDLFLDTSLWIEQYPASDAVRYICRLQEHVPGCVLPAGICTAIDLAGSCPSDAQIDAYGAMIRSLEPKRGERITFTWLGDGAADGEQIGLVFYRVSRAESGQMKAEVRIDTKRRRSMYEMVCSTEESQLILRYILKTGAAPDVSGWRDITEEVYGKKDILRVTPAMLEREPVQGQEAEL